MIRAEKAKGLAATIHRADEFQECSMKRGRSAGGDDIHTPERWLHEQQQWRYVAVAEEGSPRARE
jgi:hypothetical protein